MIKFEKEGKYVEEAINRVEWIKIYSKLTKDKILEEFGSSEEGFLEIEREKKIKENKVNEKNNLSLEQKYKFFFVSFISMFNFIILFLIVISIFSSAFIIKSKWGIRIIIILILMIIINSFFKFYHERKSDKILKTLKKRVDLFAVIRVKDKGLQQIKAKNIVLGDIIILSQGDVIPADVIFIEVKKLFLNQEIITGDFTPCEKFIELNIVKEYMDSSEDIYYQSKNFNNPREVEVSKIENIGLMGTEVEKGEGIGLVIGIGEDTYLGSMKAILESGKNETHFNKNIEKISNIAMQTVIIIIPIIFFINFFMKKDLLMSLLFSICIGIGAILEILPLIIKINLTRGALNLSKKGMIVKDLETVQNLASMNILCVEMEINNYLINEELLNLSKLGIKIKIFTEAKELILKEIDFKIEGKVSEIEINKMSDEELLKELEKITFFIGLSSFQKCRVVRLLQDLEYIVGYIGSGDNESSELRQSNVGFSRKSSKINSREAADIILFEEKIELLREGILEARKSFENIIKYIKTGASLNLGNILSLLVGSLFLPFLPLLPIHILIQNFLYNTFQVTIPWDNVGIEELKKPKKIKMLELKKIIFCIAPVNFICDIITFVVLWFLFYENNINMPNIFQTGYFIEVIIIKIFITQLVRTKRIPFVQSRPSFLVGFMSVFISSMSILMVFTGVGEIIKLSKLPLVYSYWLIVIVFSCFIFIFNNKEYYK